MKKNPQELENSKATQFQSEVGKEASWLIEKQDITNIVIITAIALVIGIYLIVTTVLISKDGMFYISQAQKLQSDPANTIKLQYIGYPFLIFCADKFAALFSDSTSVQFWIYIAQTVSLLCRLLALCFLYFIGKLLLGSKKSFLAILILLLLPYPAKIGSDVLREWPHILFLAIGLLSLLCGAKQGKWWLFGIAGIASGLGHLVRPECMQIVMDGTL